MSTTTKHLTDEKTTSSQKQQFFIPHQIKADAIKKNHKLLSDEQISKAKALLRDAAYGRHSKEIFKHLGIPYGLLKGKHGLYAIYNETSQVELGRGAFGAVKIAQNLETGEWNVVKTEIVGNSKVSFQNQERLSERYDLFSQEIKTLIFLNKTKEGIFNRSSKKKPHISKADIVFKYARGENLYNLILEAETKLSRFSDMKRLDVIIAILNNYIADIFNKGFLHRDLKLENIIYDFNTDTVEIVDYGFAQSYDQSTLSYQDDYAPGTEMYQAPEVISKFLFSDKSEIYALGLLFKEMLLNQVSETEDTDKKLLFTAYGPATLFKNNKPINDFIERMLAENPEQRPDLAEVQLFLIKFRNDLIKSKEKSSTVSILQKMPALKSNKPNLSYASQLNDKRLTAVSDVKALFPDKYSLFKFELDNYIKKLQNLSRTKLLKSDVDLQIHAANKMYNLLSGINVKFTREDIAALRHAKELSFIIGKYEKKNLLPAEFISAEGNKRPLFKR
jgi:serine/threonine protein kinase